MKRTIATACAVITLAFAGAAAAEGKIVATLDGPQSTQGKLIAAHAVWNCQGATCVASVASDEAVSASACQDLAKQVGPLSAYAGQYKSLDAKALAKCNIAARGPATIGTASR
ncbi:MAG TPA: hypothetical protein VII73_13130 [Caulobacteraceae bacterium]